MSPRPTSSEEVWNATHEHSKLFTDAAHKVGLTDSQYQAFRNALLDGKAVYVKMPRRMDAMAGQHRDGTVYAVKNAVMTSSQMGWVVSLADGTQVYVPQVCGNLSVLRSSRIAHAPPPFVQSIAHVPIPPETPVALTPPAADVAVAAPATAAEAIVPVASHGLGALPFFIPAIIGGGIWAGVSHSAPPPCNNGSNVTGACTK